MDLFTLRRIILASSVIFLTAITGLSQSGRKSAPSPSPAPSVQDRIRVFTEEIRLPVMAFDDWGHFDPTLAPEDLLVLEDGVQQQVKSVTHVPPHVLIVLDMSTEITVGKNTGDTREAARNVIDSIRRGGNFAIMQFADKVEVLQGWTQDRAAAKRVLENKLLSGRRSRLGEAIATAADLFEGTPAGSRHVVLITVGMNTAGRVQIKDAARKLAESQAILHVISWGDITIGAIERRLKQPPIQGGGGTTTDPIQANDPTLPPGTTRNPTLRIGRVTLDRKTREHYEKTRILIARGEDDLRGIVEETGGQMLLPKTYQDLAELGAEVASEIGAQYVVTYKPKRPLATAAPGEYRKIEVVARRLGVQLKTRRGYIVAR